MKQNNWQEDLKDLLNCDLKTLYPIARSLKRKLEFYVGPTNSGKTYNAMKVLKEANSGLYLAPLRLLALEGYEDLKEAKIEASLKGYKDGTYGGPMKGVMAGQVKNLSDADIKDLSAQIAAIK